MAIVAVIMSVNFAACSDDDEEESTPTTENIVGQWVLTYEEGYEIEPEYPEENREWSHAPKDECEYFGNLTFRADGTYTEYDLDNSELDEGKWALSNKLLTLRPIDATYALDLNVLEISNSKLVLEYMEKEDDGGVEYAKMTYKMNQSRLNLTVTYKKNKFVTENRLSYDNIRKGHQEQTGIA